MKTETEVDEILGTLERVARAAKREALEDVAGFIDRIYAEGPERSLHEDEMRIENYIRDRLRAAQWLTAHLRGR